MSKKLKAIESTIQPNHKEAELWVTPTENDGTKCVKYWNRKEDKWSECGGGNDKVIYYELQDGIVEGSDKYYFIIDVTANLKFLTSKGYIWGHFIISYEDNVPSGYPIKAIAFMPTSLDVSVDGEENYTHVPDFETFFQLADAVGGSKYSFNDIFKHRITAEEYWDTSSLRYTFTIAIEFGYYVGPTSRDALSYVIKEYEYVPGMTLNDWLNSEYNIDGLTINSDYAFVAPWYSDGRYDSFNLNFISYDDTLSTATIDTFITQERKTYIDTSDGTIVVNYYVVPNNPSKG